MKESHDKFVIEHLVRHMNQYGSDTWEQHALWAKSNLNVEISPDECASIYMESLFGK